MRLLIDTHTFLWFVEGDLQLSQEAKRLLEDENNERWLSLASVWEMAIKISIGKLRLGQPLAEYVREQTERNTISLLPITLPHVLPLTNLPLHHRDPFDRLLVMQSVVEGMPIVSADAVLDAYNLHRLW
ncbi:MAG TPA: type II toxin-antitoxin system VapC family toxin [Chthonomonadaceae bacterium]|nr:type II toxin-antitoxin system VapC family toxin [Chthonomonadaceae bacterium]